MILEVCVDGIEDIKVCNDYVDIISRVELNHALLLGGLTPTIELVKKSREVLEDSIDLVCMLRLRAGDFYYTDLEFEIMYNHAKEMIKYCNGIVFGALNKDNSIDIEKTEKILKLCHDNNKEFVFHRAIDVVNDYFKSLKQLDELGIDRVLTSGHENTAVIGIDNLKEIKENFEVLAGCGINPGNVNLFENFQVHGSFSEEFDTNFGKIQRISKTKLDKLRETKLFEKSNAIFIHGAGINATKYNGDSLTSLVKNPKLLSFKYNQKMPIIKQIQDTLDIQLYGTDAVNYLVNYKFHGSDIKYVCGHSVGAYNVLKAFSDGIIDYKNFFARKYPENVDFIELGSPRIDEIKSYINEASKRSKYILIELIEDDKLELNLEDINSISALQYGDRSVEKFEEIFKNIKLPNNVFVIKINKIKTNSKDYLANVNNNHALLFKKNSEINKKIQRIRLEFIEIIKNKDRFLTDKAKLKKLRELEEEFNKKYLK